MIASKTIPTKEKIIYLKMNGIAFPPYVYSCNIIHDIL